MAGQRARGVTLAVLATLAVALTAVAVGPVFTEYQPVDTAEESRVAPDESTDDGTLDLPVDAIYAVIAVVGAVGFLVQFSREPRETLKQSVRFGVYAVAIAAGVGYVYTNIDWYYYIPRGEESVLGRNISLTAAPTASGGPQAEGGDPLVFPVESLLAVVVVAGAFGLVAVFAWQSETVRSALGLDRTTDDADPEAGSLDAVGRAAGRAADRVDDATTPSAADDAVYGAWRDMVGLLGVDDPRSGTPRQFARAATEAGLDPDDVSALTRAFEAVRYGDVTLSADRREAVTEAFRRIEADHGSDDGGRVGDGRTADEHAAGHWRTDDGGDEGRNGDGEGEGKEGPQ